jgi:hypothetical protein
MLQVQVNAAVNLDAAFSGSNGGGQLHTHLHNLILFDAAEITQ